MSELEFKPEDFVEYIGSSDEIQRGPWEVIEVSGDKVTVIAAEGDRWERFQIAARLVRKVRDGA